MYYVRYELIANEDGSADRFQFYVYKDVEDDWIDAYPTDNIDDGYRWAIEWVRLHKTQERIWSE